MVLAELGEVLVEVAHFIAVGLARHLVDELVLRVGLAALSPALLLCVKTTFDDSQCGGPCNQPHTPQE